MEQIKTAMEIALEKTAHLKRASAEEIRRKKEEEAASLATGLVQKYLRGENKLKDLVIATEHHPEKEIMSRALWRQLVAAIHLERCDNVLEGLELLAGDKESVKHLTDKVKEIGKEFHLVKVNKLQMLNEKIEQNFRQEQAQKGISGSAIEVDVESTEQWRQYLQELEARFQAKLELTKESLSRLEPGNN